jgi:hypothetical protein|tara:strand:- start:184 stop:438 length:255 start_codon:yes stop_codon:yes gene_type:complete
MSNIIDKIIKEFDGVLIDEYGWEHYTVNGKDYDIRFDRSRLEWACDCPAFKFRRRHKIKYCKHILEVQTNNLARRSGRAGARVV